ncbi:MAG: LLM class flavin-dependent oxidoreductase [Rhodospirillaceae bacterium]
MEIDLFCELAKPPAANISQERIFSDLIEVARAADRLGVGALWLPEHHFLGDYSTSAAPDMVLAAIARETTRLKLGFAILPLPIHDPVRIAERLATLDALSNGRVLWGVGRGVTTTELEGFGENPGESRQVFLEKFKALAGLLETGGFTREGKDFSLNPAPAPRLRNGWIAAVSPETFDLAADLGLDIMTGPFKPWPMVERDLARYRRLRPEGKTSFAMACYCGDDHAAARKRAEDGLVWAYRRVFEVAQGILKKQVAGYEHYRKLGWLTPVLDKVLSLAVLETLGLAAVGDADHVAARLSKLQAAGLDRVSLIIGGGDLTAAEQVRCLERLAVDVLPRLGTVPAGNPQMAPA